MINLSLPLVSLLLLLVVELLIRCLQFVAGKFHGKGLYHFANGKKVESEFVGGKPVDPKMLAAAAAAAAAAAQKK